VEFICKFDYDDPQVGRYLEIVRGVHASAHTKSVVSDRLNGYWSIHTYLNDLFAMTGGKILWILGDDIMADGDWFGLLKETRNVFADNIYVVNISGPPEKRSKMICPVVSREWVDALDMVSPHPAADRFLASLASRSGRLISRPAILKGISITHNKRLRIGRAPTNFHPKQIKANIEYHVNRLLPEITSKLKG
jgi:hypothetical protein